MRAATFSIAKLLPLPRCFHNVGLCAGNDNVEKPQSPMPALPRHPGRGAVVELTNSFRASEARLVKVNQLAAAARLCRALARSEFLAPLTVASIRTAPDRRLRLLHVSENLSLNLDGQVETGNSPRRVEVEKSWPPPQSPPRMSSTSASASPRPGAARSISRSRCSAGRSRSSTNSRSRTG
jgi:hypothetical protein